VETAEQVSADLTLAAVPSVYDDLALLIESNRPF
jgi:hypothetical protein